MYAMPFGPPLPSLSVELINLRFNYLIEAFESNPELCESPFLRAKVLQDLRDKHVDLLSMAARQRGDLHLQRLLSEYQALIWRVRDGITPHALFTELPAHAGQAQAASHKAALETDLYEQLLDQLGRSQPQNLSGLCNY